MPSHAHSHTGTHRRVELRRQIAAAPLAVPRHRVLVVAARPWERLRIVDDLVERCEVASVASCRDAVRVLADPSLFCSVVSYLDLGDGPDGVDLMDAARRRRSRASIVLITAPPRTADEAERFVRARRAHQMLLTPWNRGDVLASVCAACDVCTPTR
jgi:hypothetical protein